MIHLWWKHIRSPQIRTLFLDDATLCFHIVNVLVENHLSLLSSLTWWYFRCLNYNSIGVHWNLFFMITLLQTSKECAFFSILLIPFICTRVRQLCMISTYVLVYFAHRPEHERLKRQTEEGTTYQRNPHLSLALFAGPSHHVPSVRGKSLKSEVAAPYIQNPTFNPTQKPSLYRSTVLAWIWIDTWSTLCAFSEICSIPLESNI